ncbi:hypothetical protein HPB48_012902 [Haemaphysalis longicornis]|uniref:Uncharacterized protein n=1 Tax=Haemaphysalis longicornis TaxID=44386 RepID=A0A9J6FHC4_HAELO|nr:hypothetical protein HPB48_012902 [Haemaphysalis longicornis]
MEMEQQLVPGADGDAAVVEAHDSDEEEYNCMHQDDESLVESQNLSEKGKTGSVKSWSEVISRAQRRRDQRQLRITDNQTKQAPSPSPTARPSRPTLRQARHWFKPLPRDHCKLVLRPRGGLNLQHILPSQLTLALLHATSTTLREANIHLQIDQAQNTATISTPNADGEKSTTVILTFPGSDVPRCVYLYGTAPRYTPHKKTVPVSSVWYEVGHRNTACPRPGTRACHECGTRDPGPDHNCVAKCSLCEGAHVTGAKDVRGASSLRTLFAVESSSSDRRKVNISACGAAAAVEAGPVLEPKSKGPIGDSKTKGKEYLQHRFNTCR